MFTVFNSGCISFLTFMCRMLLIFLQYIIGLHVFFKTFFFLNTLGSGVARPYGQSLVFFTRYFVVTFIMTPTEYTPLVP